MTVRGRAFAQAALALDAVDAAFEKHLRKPEELCAGCAFSKRGEPEVEAAFQRFDAVVRAHRARRLELPVRAIWDESFGHGSALVHCSVRRFAWFLPALLAAALEADFAGTLARTASLALEAWRGEKTHPATCPGDFSRGERDALDAFWRAALSEAATTDDVAAVFLAAVACDGATTPLVDELLDSEPLLVAVVTSLHELDPTWTRAEEARFDRDRLLREPAGPRLALRVLRDALFVEETRRRLEARCLDEAVPERVVALSRAEAMVRRAF
jgi:hypothetical protein